jgi:UDP:flavonoid glycosyltransferase YjiC (YdhE family)
LEGRNNDPLVYVTMGSTVDAQSTLVKLIEALRGAPYNVVLTTGSLSLPLELELPPKIQVFPTVPGATVLRRSAAVVHHGGHGTLLQALAAGVPSLLAPSNPDQILVARAAEAMGIGRNLWRPGGIPLGVHCLDAWSPAQIRQELDALLADGECLKACQSFQRGIATYHGAEAAARVLEGMAARDQERKS